MKVGERKDTQTRRCLLGMPFGRNDGWAGWKDGTGWRRGGGSTLEYCTDVWFAPFYRRGSGLGAMRGSDSACIIDFSARELDLLGIWFKTIEEWFVFKVKVGW